MVSYWKLLKVNTEEILGIGDEKSMTDLKIRYENKLNTKTKMIKCFGKENYKFDMECQKRLCESLEEQIKIYNRESERNS